MSNFEEVNKLIESNAKAIQKMINLRDSILPRIDKMQRQVADMQQQVANMQKEVANMQRHRINSQKRYSDNTDIKELMLENQRILNYLESLNK
ncbi:hypothetical protein NIES4071_74550 [Calothrix sp. NIES-4071]|nr:hypothetical protein NIES4071_74550 [Calothrix sp. NIES-4071]BAZ61730.1 hypothetical protein NIES4105_74500 [Calothrix sp. NIES-4105]